jgi:hypothetical protein
MMRYWTAEELPNDPPCPACGGLRCGYYLEALGTWQLVVCACHDTDIGTLEAQGRVKPIDNGLQDALGESYDL